MFIFRISMLLLNVYFHVFIMHISHALDNHRGRSKERGGEKRERRREREKERAWISIFKESRPGIFRGAWQWAHNTALKRRMRALQNSSYHVLKSEVSL